MNARERVRRAIHFRRPDRIPHYLPDGGENDILWLWPERPPDRQDWQPVNGRQRRVDAWSVVWERASEETFGEAVVWPIADITQQAAYELPDVNNPRYLADVRRRIEENNASDNPRYCLGVMPASSLNEGTHNLMGLENMFLAYREHPDELKAWIARLAAAQRASIRALAECGCDGIMGYDDWGLQYGLMVRPSMVEAFFGEHYRRNWALAHALGMDVWLHSCGHIVDLLPTLADWGVNVMQMDQQENMGLEAIDAAVGGRVAFWCPVDIQATMITGDAAAIERYVQRMIGTLGGHNGGLISMAYSTPEAVHHTPEKVAAMCAAFRRHGWYQRPAADHEETSC